MKLQFKWLLLATCVGIGAGCSPLAPQPDYSKFYVLTPIADSSSAPAVAGSSHPLVIGLGPIDFPDYLRRPQVVTRTSTNELHLSPVDRWGEPLDENFRRVLSDNLGQLLGTEDIVQYPWSHKAGVNYQVLVTVQRFETNSDGQSQLRAQWIIRDGATGKSLYASQTNATTPAGPATTPSAAALSADLGDLSQAIATEINQLGERRMTSSAATNQTD